MSDDKLPVLRGTTRMLSSQECDESHEKIKIIITTDNYGYETSWELRDSQSVIVKQVPSQTYASNKKYRMVVCLPRETYTLTVGDIWGDGICCGQGQGSFQVLQKNDGAWENIVSIGEFKKESVLSFSLNKSFSNDTVDIDYGINEPTHNPTHSPTRNPTSVPTVDPTQIPTKKPTPTPSNRSIERTVSLCTSSMRKVKVEVMTDRYGEDTSWEILDPQGNTLIASEKDYGQYENDIRIFCLEDGQSYDFILHDSVGDGMCCSYGKGYYKIFVEEEASWNSWKEILNGGSFKKTEVKQIINLKERIVTPRDKEWLDSHNVRRKEWHEKNGKTYVPLKWSEALKSESMVWAERLLDSCGSGMYHDPHAIYGENVAGNSGSGSWGAKRTTEQVLSRFVEREIDDNYPKNSHLTQVLWRGTKYVGCAEASKPIGEKGMCHTQVCRYSRPGNCEMSQYKKADNDEWWMKPMMMDNSPCGPECPPDGCYQKIAMDMDFQSEGSGGVWFEIILSALN